MEKSSVAFTAELADPEQIRILNKSKAARVGGSYLDIQYFSGLGKSPGMEG